MTCIFYNSVFLLTQLQKKKGGFLLLFLLGPGVVLVHPAGGGLCQSETAQEGPSEQSPEEALCQGQGEGQPPRPLALAQQSWGKGCWCRERGRQQTRGDSPSPLCSFRFPS